MGSDEQSELLRAPSSGSFPNAWRPSYLVQVALHGPKGKFSMWSWTNGRAPQTRMVSCPCPSCIRLSAPAPNSRPSRHSTRENSLPRETWSCPPVRHVAWAGKMRAKNRCTSFAGRCRRAPCTPTPQAGAPLASAPHGMPAVCHRQAGPWNHFRAHTRSQRPSLPQSLFCLQKYPPLALGSLHVTMPAHHS